MCFCRFFSPEAPTDSDQIPHATILPTTSHMIILLQKSIISIWQSTVVLFNPNIFQSSQVSHQLKYPPTDLKPLADDRNFPFNSCKLPVFLSIPHPPFPFKKHHFQTSYSLSVCKEFADTWQSIWPLSRIIVRFLHSYSTTRIIL